MPRPVSDQRLRTLLLEWPLDGAYVGDAFDASTRNDNLLVTDSEGTRYVLHRFYRNPDLARIGFQLRFQQHLLDGGVPVPEIIATRSGETVAQAEGSWSLFSFVEGEYYDFDRMEQVDEAARTLARFHLVSEQFDEPEPDYELRINLRDYWADWPRLVGELDELFAGAGVDEELVYLREWREQLVAELPLERFDALPGRWIHEDYHGRNVLYVGDRITAVLDFDNLQGGPWAADIADAIHRFGRERRGSSHIRTAVVQRFIAAYETVRPLAPGELEAIPRLMGHRAPFAAIYRWLQGVGEDALAAFRTDTEHLRTLREQAARLAPLLLRGG